MMFAAWVALADEGCSGQGATLVVDVRSGLVSGFELVVSRAQLDGFEPVDAVATVAIGRLNLTCTPV